MEQPKCQYYLARKKRFCKFDAVPGKNYCGNHLFLHDDGSGQRVPCPADPKHTVLVSELDAHLKKCPSALLAAKEKARPHNVESVNGGADSEGEPDMTPLLDVTPMALDCSPPNGTLHPSQPPAAPAPAASPFARGRAAARAAYARSLGQAGFEALLDKVYHIHAQECGAHGPRVQLLRPACVEHLMARTGDSRPFDLKHATQQASILGHMLEAGLLPLGAPPPAPATGVLVELGAGKAGLAGMAVAMRHPSVPDSYSYAAPAAPAAAPVATASAAGATAADPAAATTPPAANDKSAGTAGGLTVEGDDAATSQPAHVAHTALASPKQMEMTSGGEGVPGPAGKALSVGATNGGWARELVGGAPVGCGARAVVLVDNRGAFQAKADRHMRGLVEIERVTIDLKDFALWRVPAMHGASGSGARVQRPRRGAPHPNQPRPRAGSSTAATAVTGTQGQGQDTSGPHDTAAPAPATATCGADTQQAAAHTTSGDGKVDVGAGVDGPPACCTTSQGPLSSTCAPPAAGSSQHPWVACGKHLCGAATDYSLRCCFAHLKPGKGQGKEAAGDRRECAQLWSDFQGAAFATCCHHRCGWQAFVGKAAWRAWGLTPHEFELVSWMTGWALCGHDAAPGCGQEGREVDGDGDGDGEAEGCQEQNGQVKTWGTGGNGTGGNGAGCAVGAGAVGEVGVGQQGQKRRPSAGAGVEGGSAAAGGGAGRRVEPRPGTPAAGQSAAPEGGAACAEVGGTGQNQKQKDRTGHLSATGVDAAAAPTRGGAGTVAAGADVLDCDMGEAGGAAAAEDQGAAVQGGPGQGDAQPAHAWDPARALPRARRMAIGAACKALIDRARLLWICDQLGLQPPAAHVFESRGVNGGAAGQMGGVQARGRMAQLVAYVPQEVSGENKLLLVKV